MKKLVLILGLCLFPFSVYAVAFTCLEFYYDKDGQTHDIDCRQAHQSPDVKCSNEGDFYWDGKACREVAVIKNCQKQGGSWMQVQLLPKPIFKNTCICPKNRFWDGEKCVSQISPSLRKNVVTVWCDKLRKNIDVYIPDAKKLLK